RGRSVRRRRARIYAKRTLSRFEGVHDDGGPVPCLAVGVDGRPPALPGQDGQRVGDRLAGVDAHRVLQAQAAEVVQLMHTDPLGRIRASGSGAHGALGDIARNASPSPAAPVRSGRRSPAPPSRHLSPAPCRTSIVIWTPAEARTGRSVGAQFPDVAASASSTARMTRTSTDGDDQASAGVEEIAFPSPRMPRADSSLQGPAHRTEPEMMMKDNEVGHAAIGAQGERRRWMSLALVVTAQFMVILDVTIVNVALPSIQRDLGFAQENLQWVITAYTIMFGATLLLGGRLADLLGRRRLLLVGPALFSFSSLLCGLPWSEGSLIAFRAAQGLGAALLVPAALALLISTFAEGPQRNLALGIYGAVLGSGAAGGVLPGGLLTP